MFILSGESTTQNFQKKVALNTYIHIAHYWHIKTTMNWKAQITELKPLREEKEKVEEIHTSPPKKNPGKWKALYNRVIERSTVLLTNCNDMCCIIITHAELSMEMKCRYRREIWFSCFCFIGLSSSSSSDLLISCIEKWWGKKNTHQKQNKEHLTLQRSRL